MKLFPICMCTCCTPVTMCMNVDCNVFTYMFIPTAYCIIKSKSLKKKNKTKSLSNHWIWYFWLLFNSYTKRYSILLISYIEKYKDIISFDNERKSLNYYSRLQGSYGFRFLGISYACMISCTYASSWDVSWFVYRAIWYCMVYSGRCRK